MAKKKSSFGKEFGSIAKAGVGLGIGSAIAAKAGAPAGVQQSFGTAGSFLGIMGGAVVAKHALKGLKDPTRKLYNKKNRRIL